jgi:hypothetical protein
MKDLSQNNGCLQIGQSILFLQLLENRMSKPTVIEIIKSVLSAAIGVQSDANRKKDFEQGSLPAYLIAGLIFTVLFVGFLIFLVSTILG